MDRTEQSAPRNSATKWTARLGLAGVSAIAAVVSYFHALAVVQAAGARAPVAYLVPFLADLVILGASAALLDASRHGQPRPALATVALAVGIAVTLAMNVAAGVAHGLAGALVAGWPAVAFILALESLAGILRRGRGEPSCDGRPAIAPATSVQSDPPEPPAVPDALKVLLATGSQRGLAHALGVPKSRVQAWAAMAREVDQDPPVSPAGDGARTVTPGAAPAGNPPYPAGATQSVNGHGGAGG